MWGDVRPCSFMSTYIRPSQLKLYCTALRDMIWYDTFIQLAAAIPSLAGRVESMGNMGGGGKDPWFRKAGTAHRTSQKKIKIHPLHVYYCHFLWSWIMFLFVWFRATYVLRLFFRYTKYLCVLLLILYLCSRHLKHKTWAMRDYQN